MLSRAINTASIFRRLPQCSPSKQRFEAPQKPGRAPKPRSWLAQGTAYVSFRDRAAALKAGVGIAVPSTWRQKRLDQR